VGRDADAVGGVAHAVRVAFSLPKQILLAGGFEVELTTRASGAPSTNSKAGEIVRVTDLILPVLIGVATASHQLLLLTIDPINLDTGRRTLDPSHA
jgi:hypothetical protein